MARIRGDRQLVQIVDAAFADAARRSGPFLMCRPGCTQCCVGVFAIDQLDAARLKHGMEELERADPERAREVRRRARASWLRLKPEFPGNTKTGILDDGEEAEESFAEFGNDEPCPALDSDTGLCALYNHRPMTCRVFGPPIASEDGLGVCDLCFQGATEAEIAACEMKLPTELEQKLNTAAEKKSGVAGQTVVAFVLK